MDYVFSIREAGNSITMETRTSVALRTTVYDVLLRMKQRIAYYDLRLCSGTVL